MRGEGLSCSRLYLVNDALRVDKLIQGELEQ